MPVKHLAVMKEYFALCEVTDRPQDMVEYDKGDGWFNWGRVYGYTNHPTFRGDWNWRIKPKTIMIGKRECVAPMKNGVSMVDACYSFNVANRVFYYSEESDRDAARDAIIALLKGE